MPELVTECGFGGWIVTVRDHERALQAAIEVDVWADIPAAVESALRAGTLPWKEFKTYRKKKKPNKGG